MALANRGRAELCSSPERTKVWTETTEKKKKKKVSVVYYLSRNGQLEQPHFMEVTLSSRDGLYLKDVINRLNYLRGNGMASLYSWSSKRSYKNGFVWHDLSEDDFVYPAQGQEEYVLKGSELLRKSQESTESERRTDFRKSKLMSAETCAKAMDAATQTEDERRRRREKRGEEVAAEEELSCDEISPPPSSSSTETLESLIKAEEGGGARFVVVKSAGGGGGGEEIGRSVGGCPSGRFRASASAVLMNLISCGAISVKNGGGGGGGPAAYQEDPKEMDGPIEMPSFNLEEKEYFSGSLIETKKKTLAGDNTSALKRSSSYNAERSSKMEMDGGRGATCIPAGKTKGKTK